jgi:hypothetical protein
VHEKKSDATRNREREVLIVASTPSMMSTTRRAPIGISMNRRMKPVTPGVSLPNGTIVVSSATWFRAWIHCSR